MHSPLSHLPEITTESKRENIHYSGCAAEGLMTQIIPIKLNLTKLNI